ncbi:MAG: SDR family NAD(P)-dependent oxidoreductase, partial [Gammaproteobacteria bacterium]|nr:SDR family NAD(P)-dependent oxidoreductase [Gammaproteobacteria bacterium]
MNDKNQKVVLITGSAKRIGACIAEHFHQTGYRVIIHYRHSRKDAEAAAQAFNNQRPNSAACIKADLDIFDDYEKLIIESHKVWGRLDVLINNASTFFPTPIGKINLNDWDLLFNSNLKAPFFLSQAAAPFLRENKGNIINIIDIHAEKNPMKNYPVYSCAKAGLLMLTRSLALELAPT